MERYYIFFRCWQHFSADFPFGEFNGLPDDEINDELEAYMVKLRRDHKPEFDRRVRDWNKQLAADARAARRSPGHKPLLDPRGATEKPAPRQPEPECSPGCRNAYDIGWTMSRDIYSQLSPLRKFGGWSPSRKQFLMIVDEPGLATNVVEALTIWWEFQGGFSRLEPQFGHVSASQFTVAERAVIESDMDDRRRIKPTNECEKLRERASVEALRLAHQILHIEGGPGDTTTTESASTTSKGSRRAGRRRRSSAKRAEDDKFYDGWRKSDMTLPDYSRAHDKTPVEGDRIRARVEKERERTNSQV